jgi:membrane-associated protease RseP (regulator of RpoE activity)
MRLRLLAAAAALTVVSPAIAAKTFAVTPSGAAETLFPDHPAAVVGQLSSKCIDTHWTVTSTTSNEVVCEAPMNFGQSVLGQVLMGNSYSTPPRRFFRFNVAEVGGISRVQASGWMELQMAFGQTRRTDFSGPEFENGIDQFMISAGGKYPQGTTFPNHAVLGIDVSQAALDGSLGLTITKFEPGSVAEKAGMAVGDIVTVIAKKRFKNTDQYLDVTAKAAETPTYEVGFLRNGRPMTVVVERAFRPPAGEIVVAKADPTAAPSASVVAPLDPADELTKLAALKDKGIITADEFAAQKKKILGN